MEQGQETPVKAWMQSHGVKAVWLAKKLGIGPQYLSVIINDWASTGIMNRWAPRIAEALGAPVEELFPNLDREEK